MRATRLLALVLAVALIGGSGAVLATDGGGARSAIEAASDGKASLGNCYFKSVPDGGGKIRVKVPAFCRNRMCRIYVSRFGDPIGAHSAGFGPGIDFIQFDDGW